MSRTILFCWLHASHRTQTKRSSLVKDWIDVLWTPITSIINLSLTKGSFSSHFKSVLVSPLLKKPSLNTDSMNKYRPVFNLSFLSTVLEKVAVNQLSSHINSSNLSNQYQSAYRQFHSIATETTLLKIHSDILVWVDAGKVTALTLIDFSAACDTVDHTILLRRLDDWSRAPWKGHDWLKSYLIGRCHRIKLGDCLSSKADFTFWVPRGSVLGPLLFTLYITGLSSMISEHAIPLYLHASGSRLYFSFASGDSAAALNGSQSYLASVNHECRWINWNWTWVMLNSFLSGKNRSGD